MELSIGEMLMIALAIVVLFGPDKIPQIARDLGQGVRKMRGAVDDIKTEIMKETDNPVSEIKREIEKVKEAAKELNPMNEAVKTNNREAARMQSPADDDLHEGPVSR